MRISDEQIRKLQELYKLQFDMDLTFDEAADAARRLVAIFVRDPVEDALNTYEYDRQIKAQEKQKRIRRARKADS